MKCLSTTSSKCVKGTSSTNLVILNSFDPTITFFRYVNYFHQSQRQCVTVPKMLNDTDTDTFIRYQIFSIPIPVLFSVPNFLDTGSETFFRYSILPIPVPRLFSGTKFFRYRFRYHQKYEKFPVPVPFRFRYQL